MNFSNLFVAGGEHRTDIVPVQADKQEDTWAVCVNYEHHAVISLLIIIHFMFYNLAD